MPPMAKKKIEVAMYIRPMRLWSTVMTQLRRPRGQTGAPARGSGWAIAAMVPPMSPRSSRCSGLGAGPSPPAQDDNGRSLQILEEGGHGTGLIVAEMEVGHERSGLDRLGVFHPAGHVVGRVGQHAGANGGAAADMGEIGRNLAI